MKFPKPSPAVGITMSLGAIMIASNVGLGYYLTQRTKLVEPAAVIEIVATPEPTEEPQVASVSADVATAPKTIKKVTPTPEAE